MAKNIELKKKILLLQLTRCLWGEASTEKRRQTPDNNDDFSMKVILIITMIF